MSENKKYKEESVRDGFTSKREDYLEREDYFMAIAFLSSQRSKDPNTQVGACIVNKKKRIVGTGYNGMPDGCHDDEMPWGRDKTGEDNKHLYVCHAKLNAIVKNSSSLEECILYVSLFPCNECAKIIIQSRIAEVVYYSDKNHDKPETRAARYMFEKAGVKYHQYIPKKKVIEINFSSIDVETTAALENPKEQETDPPKYLIL